MAALFIVALIVAVAKLWSDIRALRLRVQALEWGGAPRPVQQPYPAQPAWQPYPEQPAQPEWQPPVVEPAPMPEPAAPLSTARVVHAPAPSEDFRHPGLEPGPRFSSDEAQGSGIPAQGRDDEEAPTAPPPPPTPKRPLSFEDIFGRKLPIWAGGVTLAVCGFLIVKYSIDAGLLSPLVRVIGGLLFGTGLIAGAEAARQNAERVRDPRVAQALSGAGIATLYASILVAANLYHLIPPLAAFLFMAATTVLAGALSIRFGAPSAVLGLVGGLAAPALVGSGNPNVPLLAAYLALAVGGLATLGRAQRWWWLGVAAIIGGFGWGLVMIFAGALSIADSLSIGAFLLLLGIGLPVLLFGEGRGVFVRLVGALAATAQLAALVAMGGFAMLHWGLFGLLGAAAVWLSRREKALADLPAPALAVALLLMAAWTGPTMRDLAIVLAGATAIFGLPAIWRVWRSEARLTDAGAVCALAAAPILLAQWHYKIDANPSALIAALGALAAAGVAAMGWRNPERSADMRFVTLTATAAALAMTAAWFALPVWLVAPAWALIAAATIVLGRHADDRRVESVAWAIGAATVAQLVLDPDGKGQAIWRAVGEGAAVPDWRLALSWAIPALAALVFTRRARGIAAEPVASASAVLLAYVAAAQVVPPLWLPLVPALAVAALGWFRRSDAATVTAGALAACWAAWPLATWLAAAGGSLLGMALFVGSLPPLLDTATRILAPALAAGVVLWRHPPAQRLVRDGWIVALTLLGTVALHTAYKHVFAISTPDRFATLGLAERTTWEALIALAAVALHRRAPRIARGLGLAAFAHLIWYSILLHDPLWVEQAVGPLPVANLLVPTYGLGFVLLWAAGRTALPPLAERARGWAQMLLVLLLAPTELRQLFNGSILAGQPLSQAEDILRSVAAILIAIGFLLWGLRRRNVDWRIASLVVMLGAVTKVFLFDTSGLDGLLRIASFAALGFSLIGIGWLYSRFLPDSATVNPSVATSA